MDSSMNLNTLASSLPSSSQAIAEKELLNDFKAAALSITTLYRSSRRTSKRAYNAGYATACNDLLMFIQQGVSTGGAGNELENGGEGMTIGRVMDWVEARMEAIKSREEEEDEDAEGMDGRGRSAAASASALSTGRNGSADGPLEKQRSDSQNRPLSNTRQRHTLRPTPPPQIPTSPASPAPTVLPLAPLPSSKRGTQRQRSVREKDKGKDREGVVHPVKEVLQQNVLGSAPQTSSVDGAGMIHPMMQVPGLFSVPSSPVLLNASVGSKRRHAALTELGSQSNAGMSAGNLSFGSAVGTSRRRTRAHGASKEGLVSIVGHASDQGDVTMDVEDEGRERKRIARR